MSIDVIIIIFLIAIIFLLIFFADFYIPRFPDAVGTVDARQTLRFQLDFVSNAPRDQIRLKELLLR